MVAVFVVVVVLVSLLSSFFLPDHTQSHGSVIISKRLSQDFANKVYFMSSPVREKKLLKNPS